eukprot:95015-Alexandrium_andersonii.AAC.1
MPERMCNMQVCAYNASGSEPVSKRVDAYIDMCACQRADRPLASLCVLPVSTSCWHVRTGAGAKCQPE